MKTLSEFNESDYRLGFTGALFDINKYGLAYARAQVEETNFAYPWYGIGYVTCFNSYVEGRAN